MLKSIDAQRGPLYNWAGPATAEAVVVAVADSKVSVRSFFPLFFLQHTQQGMEETCAKAATVLQNASISLSRAPCPTSLSPKLTMRPWSPVHADLSAIVSRSIMS
jgi:hypothetical protein